MDTIPEFDAPDNGALSGEMRAAFSAAGVIKLRGFAEAKACAALREHAGRLVDAFDPGAVPHVFSTTSNAQLDDDYFIESGGDIRFFFEEGAFDETGQLKQPKVDCLNKMGHAMHDLDPAFERFTRTPKLAATVRSLGVRDPRLVQSMYIFKPPGLGGEVVCHQDSTYLYTVPESCIGFWFAIDDADRENGCMEFVPGAHHSPLRKLNQRTSTGKLITKTIDETPFPDHRVAAPAKRGDLVIFHGRTPHLSAPNRSARPRHAYTVHVVDGACIWPTSNWLQRPPLLPFRGFE